MSPRWVFMRHAESVANRDGWYAGHLDAPLTDRGREQAREASEDPRLRGISHIWSSDLTRARETAELVAEALGVPVRTTPAQDVLREDGRHLRLLTWEGRPPGGESHADVLARAMAWLREQSPALDTLFVTHGALLRATLGHLDGTPTAMRGQRKIANAGLFQHHAWDVLHSMTTG